MVIAPTVPREVFMGHRNARLTPDGRPLLLVVRVREDGWPVAHAAKAMGVSRQCAHRWLARFDAEGMAGLEDRSSRPHRMPNRIPDYVRFERRGRFLLGISAIRRSASNEGLTGQSCCW